MDHETATIVMATTAGLIDPRAIDARAVDFEIRSCGVDENAYACARMLLLFMQDRGEWRRFSISEFKKFCADAGHDFIGFCGLTAIGFAQYDNSECDEGGPMHAHVTTRFIEHCTAPAELSREHGKEPAGISLAA